MNSPFTLLLLQVFSRTVAWLYFVKSLWSKHFSSSSTRANFNASKCTSADKTQSNQQRLYLFLHWRHRSVLLVEQLLSLSKTSVVAELWVEFGKSCVLELKFLGGLSWWPLVLEVVSKSTLWLMDSSLLDFCWPFSNTSHTLDWRIHKLSPQFLTTGSVLIVCSTFTTSLVLVSFGFDSIGEKSLVSHNFLFLSLDGTWRFSESAEIIMLLNGL